ncbi:pentapeptide repeat-containing protein [candidate division TA06 bacterium]|uniref:Pentapeptide repeat-containing protein n=1 Tax=candidate division TA06 bacterium TaxID=2250710 RepID=A0A523UU01_UNCT6|nr:MAG: pentapeptide repeat-containing protein [candidate division TA06 bacterium]
MKIQSPKDFLDVRDGTIPECKFDNLNMSNSHFHNINLSDTNFDDINMSKVTFHNINMSDGTLDCINMGGVKFIHIGPAPDEDGKQERQRPITFEEMMLCDSKFNKVDMSGVEIKECNIEGMKIDGILVSEMIKAYKKQT